MNAAAKRKRGKEVVDPSFSSIILSSPPPGLQRMICSAARRLHIEKKRREDGERIRGESCWSEVTLQGRAILKGELLLTV
jgi:hypothetical protein